MKKMKYFWAGIMLCWVAAGDAAGSDLTLFSENGDSGNWDIVSYKPLSGLVTLTGEAGRISQPLESFSEFNRQKIHAWYLDHLFLSKSSLKVTLKRRKPSSREGDLERVAYELIVENRSTVAISGITIECRMFYEDGIGEHLKQINGTFEVALDPRESRTLRTRTLVMKHEDDEWQGIYACMRRTDRTGTVQERVYKNGKVPKERDWPDL